MSRFDANTLNEACASLGLPWRVLVFDEITSTSDVVRDAALTGEQEGLVVFAESQTSGRGRRDNRWSSSIGKDLMFSLLLRPDAPVGLWSRLTTLAAVALCRAIENEFPVQPMIKWPNDIYLNDLKLSGLLAEAVNFKGELLVVLGIGMNVNSTDFPPELSHSATSLLMELKSPTVREIDRQALALEILHQLQMHFQRIEHGFPEIISEVRERSWLLGRQIRAMVNGHELYGRAIDLNAEGHLQLLLPDGTSTTLSSADGVRRVV